jgi:hypothetical protein
VANEEVANEEVANEKAANEVDERGAIQVDTAECRCTTMSNGLLNLNMYILLCLRQHGKKRQ